MVKGLSIVVHSCINSIEPPGSAEISQIAIKRCGKEGHPATFVNKNFRNFNKNTSKLAFTVGVNKYFASGMVIKRGE